MINVAVIGASGYTGGELVRLIAGHPNLQLSVITGHSNAGKNILEVFPYLRGFADCMIETLDVEQVAACSDFAFLALPHGHAVEIAGQLIARGVRVIDLGADFRFDDPTVYEQWYKTTHANHELNTQAVYGLPEIWRERVREARLIANPGCYVTCSTLGLYPLVKKGVLDLDSIIIDAKSGVSGAGKTPSSTVVYSECNDSISAYKVASHRHTPEIEQNLSNICGKQVLVTFTPHLTPMTRGILATSYAKLNCQLTIDDLQEMYKEVYNGEYFIRLLPQGVLPQTKWVAGSNFCDIGLTLDSRTGRVIVCSAIDNLGKGAASQAMQNLNIMCGFEETCGIGQAPIFP